MPREDLRHVGPRATNYEELRPLGALVRAGKLFEVQAWIQSGRPVNQPSGAAGIPVRRLPLDDAVDLGFHSMVQVLLEAGAETEADRANGPFYRAVRSKRLDLVELFVQHGVDASLVDMDWVFETWSPELIRYFTDRGADVCRENKLARALCCEVRKALGFLKNNRAVPAIQEQGDIALRHHCWNGHSKWVALLLWAGADPLTAGPTSWNDLPYDDSCTAAQMASRHPILFKLGRFREHLGKPEMNRVLGSLGAVEGHLALRQILARGVCPNDQPNGGSSAIQRFLEQIADGGFGVMMREARESRSRLRAIHIVTRNGGLWRPQNALEICLARRTLRQLRPEYTYEFVWLMSQYGAAAPDDLRKLLRSPLAEHVAKRKNWLAHLVDAAESKLGAAGSPR